MVKAKYQKVLDLGEQLNIRSGDVKEEEGRVHIQGITDYQYEKDLHGMK